MHYGTKDMLDKHNIPYQKHKATRLEKEDYDKYDHIICMDSANISNTLRLFNKTESPKIYKLLKNKDVKDPWYTGNFTETYEDIDKGTDMLIRMFKI